MCDLGVDILWLMPINPIGEQNRKGGLGSPYAVRDYLAVNPEFGTLEDLRGFVDYDQPGLREYMADAMAHWVREADVDGFRCDVAGYVPLDFWEAARAQLEQIKPVFLLTEWENRDLHVGAFDATYAWSWNETMHHIAHGRASATDLKV
ncbi:alpha-amylase family glycosyl hydrolase [Serinicoccus sp. CNJ-927]|uniref:alpha-amylase family glycosyl hydrolase n=1 Tax=Serinicoccus sp. CNJ-927 TaxID=1904970 RepID=UPI0022A9131D|nr:alpha-amylase family glycosyl hydrolase [Serinicoccus sp. CNJ-927]